MVLAMASPQLTKDAAVNLATEALARDLGLSKNLIELRRATTVDWPDTSLGCPKAGEVYVQVVTPGYLVTLQADGRVFAVHVGPDRAIVCGSAFRELGGGSVKDSAQVEAETQSPIPLPEAPVLRELVTQARKDLAKRLSVEPEVLDLIEISEVLWPDASLGCPQPGKIYPQVTREGYLIRLRFGKRIYRYHSGQGGAPFLCENPAR
jgi:hypothetical protein